MVDFQSRDTRRSVGDDESEGPGDTADTGEADPAEPADGASSATEDTDSADEAVSGKPGFAVVSIGTRRSVDQDAPGDAVIEEIDAAGGHVVTREVIDASYDGVQSDLNTLVERRDVTAVAMTGGTGVEPDDVTIEAVEPMLDKTLPGFGELLRRLCFDDQGASVIRTRATAGVVQGVPVFCLPGNPDLSRRAVREIVVPEADTIDELAGPDTPK